MNRAILPLRLMGSAMRAVCALLLLACQVYGAMTCVAQSTKERIYRCVEVTLVDGSVICGCPDGQFFIDYESRMVVLTDWEKVDMYLDADQITGWCYRSLTQDDITTGTETIESDSPRFDLTDCGLQVHGANADVEVYDMRGDRVARKEAAPEILISFDEMGAGLYIIRCGGTSLKFMVR